MKKILVLKSPLHDQKSVLQVRRGLMDALKKWGVEICDPTDNISEDVVCFIGTGGTEETFRECYDKLKAPITILSDGYHNSFAASFEIASFLEQKGIPHKLVNIPLDCNDFGQYKELFEDDLSVYDNPKVKKYLSESVIGLVGGASSWLISSDIDKESVSKRFGARFIDIPIKELEDAYKSLSSASTPLAEAERMYVALKSIVSKYELTALTIKCFDLLKPCGTTACLALSKLNDEGIISGCEGDIPTMWTMMVAYAMTGKAPFMANPSSSDIGKNTVDFAHCTIPLNMVSSYALTTHFESGIGIGIKGKLPEGEYYVMKIGGRNLEKLFMVKGHIICNTEIKERCRTQVRFEFATSQDFSAFMAKRLGNHIVLFPTD